MRSIAITTLLALALAGCSTIGWDDSDNRRDDLIALTNAAAIATCGEIKISTDDQAKVRAALEATRAILGDVAPIEQLSIAISAIGDFNPATAAALSVVIQRAAARIPKDSEQLATAKAIALSIISGCELGFDLRGEG